MTSLSVRRPLLILMCVILVLLFGSISLANLPLDLLPNFDAPAITVVTIWPGAGPRDIESEISVVLEKELVTVSNLDSLATYSLEGVSLVVLRFGFGSDMSQALSQARDKVDKAVNDLPESVNRPLVEMVNLSAKSLATMIVSGSDEQDKLVAYGENVVKTSFERLDGVVSSEVSGHQVPEIHVDAIPAQLSRYQTTLTNIIGSLTLANLSFPYGEITSAENTITVRGVSELTSLEDVAALAIPTALGSTVRLDAVANISIGAAKQSSLFRYNGEPSLLISIQKQQTANAVQVMDLVQAELARLNAANPDMQLTVITDQSQFIRQSLGNVLDSLVGGALLAIVVIYLFLRDIETSLIIATSIPISVIGAIAGLYFSGATLNIISLGGLALGIGMLVDNSIVVIESIFQEREQGHDPITSAISGTQKVAGAIVASTLTTIAVFVPVVFTTGISGIIFKDLSMAVVYSLAFSLLVALTFVPSLSATLGQVRVRTAGRQMNIPILSWLYRPIDFISKAFMNTFERINTGYRDVLALSLRFPGRVMLISLTIAAVSLVSTAFLGFEFMPSIDQGSISITVSLPQSLPIHAATSYLEDIEARLQEVEEIDSITTAMGNASAVALTMTTGNDATFTCILVPLAERSRSNSEVAEHVRQILATYPDGDVRVNAHDSIMDIVTGSGAMSGFELTVKGADTLVLRELERQILDALTEVPGLRNVQSSLSSSKTEARIHIDTQRALTRGVNPQNAIGLFRSAIEGNVPATATLDGDNVVDIRVRIAPEYLDSLESLDYLMVPNALGDELPLAAFATVEEAPGVGVLSRIDREPGFLISGSAYGSDINTVTQQAEAIVQKMDIPQGYVVDVGGDNQMMNEAFTGLVGSLQLAVVLVYMVMVAQFESLKLPFLIMFSIPFAMTGAVFGLVITQQALSISSFIGLIVLAGVVVNNAIVLIDSIETERKLQPEAPLHDIVSFACQIRLRPVVMTTLTTVIALIPLALGIGEGSSIMAPMAAAVVGGLTLSTLVTLILIPTMYTAVEQYTERSRLKNSNAPKSPQSLA